MMRKEWAGFAPGDWMGETDVRMFIQLNYTPYEGDDSFLQGPTDKTKKHWDKVLKLLKEESEKSVLDAETKIPSAITAFGPGYVDKELEEIVGLQTDKPLKRGIMPNGGLRVVKQVQMFRCNKHTHKPGFFTADGIFHSQLAPGKRQQHHR